MYINTVHTCGLLLLFLHIIHIYTCICIWYLCTYVHVYVYMYIYIYICQYARMYVRMSVCMHAYLVEGAPKCVPACVHGWVGGWVIRWVIGLLVGHWWVIGSLGGSLGGSRLCLETRLQGSRGPRQRPTRITMVEPTDSSQNHSIFHGCTRTAAEQEIIPSGLSRTREAFGIDVLEVNLRPQESRGLKEALLVTCTWIRGSCRVYGFAFGVQDVEFGINGLKFRVVGFPLGGSCLGRSLLQTPNSLGWLQGRFMVSAR